MYPQSKPVRTLWQLARSISLKEGDFARKTIAKPWVIWIRIALFKAYFVTQYLEILATLITWLINWSDDLYAFFSSKERKRGG